MAKRSVLEKGPSVSFEPAITALLNELNRLTGELAIIFDDYHVIELPGIHQSLTYLLEHLPSPIHLYIASRIDLNVPTARLLAKDKLQRILMQDLSFELDEGGIWIRRIYC